MLGRIAALAVLMAAAGCAGFQSAGRTAQRTDAPAPAASQPAPAPTQPALPPPQPGASTPQPAPLVTAPTDPAPGAPAAAPAAPAPIPSPAETASVDEENAIVVPGQRDIQVAPPGGDPRSVAERLEDVRAWDQCVMQVQSAFESDPMRPQLNSPEEYCSRSLGMANRTAVPLSRRVP